MLWPLILLLASTVVASALSILLLHHLLAPLFSSVRVIKRAQEKETYELLPEGYQDELGYLMRQLNTFLNLYKQLQAALKNADAVNREKDVFISVINHKLRTPLTSLKGAIALALSDQVGESNEKVRSLLEIADRNSKRMSSLVDNILLAQKIDIDALVLDKKVIDLNKVLKESFEDIKPFSSTCQLKIISKNENMLPVMGDEFAVRQIIDNMVSNAVKFSEKGGVVQGLVIENCGKIRVSIIDDGEGIPKGMEEIVFGRFEQVSNSKQGSTQGSGLGLHISRMLANRMSGKLWYESTVGVGTEFHLEFEKADVH